MSVNAAVSRSQDIDIPVTQEFAREVDEAMLEAEQTLWVAGIVTSAIAIATLLAAVLIDIL